MARPSKHSQAVARAEHIADVLDAYQGLIAPVAEAQLFPEGVTQPFGLSGLLLAMAANLERADERLVQAQLAASPATDDVPPHLRPPSRLSPEIAMRLARSAALAQTARDTSRISTLEDKLFPDGKPKWRSMSDVLSDLLGTLRGSIEASKAAPRRSSLVRQMREHCDTIAGMYLSYAKLASNSLALDLHTALHPPVEITGDFTAAIDGMEDDRHVFEIELFELSTRVNLAVDVVATLRDMLSRMRGAVTAQARAEAEAGRASGGGIDLLDATANQGPLSQVREYLGNGVRLLHKLLPGVIQMVMERREELEAFREDFERACRSNTPLPEVLTQSGLSGPAERGRLFLKGCDAVAGVLDYLAAQQKEIYLRMGVTSLPDEVEEKKGN